MRLKKALDKIFRKPPLSALAPSWLWTWKVRLGAVPRLRHLRQQETITKCFRTKVLTPSRPPRPPYKIRPEHLPHCETIQLLHIYYLYSSRYLLLYCIFTGYLLDIYCIFTVFLLDITTVAKIGLFHLLFQCLRSVKFPNNTPYTVVL